MNDQLDEILFGTLDENYGISLAILGMRIYAGYTIMRAGLDKIPLPTWMTDQVIQMGMPAAETFAWIASFSEFAFGLLLVLGLLTRISGFFLAVTMGMASFAFHGLYPFVSMHLAQHFFWIFIVFTFLGGGKFSLDRVLSDAMGWTSQKILGLGGCFLIILLGYGIYAEISAPPPEPNQGNEIQSVNIPGSFNDWNPKSNKMTEISEDNYELIREFDKGGVIDFKFTINGAWNRNFGEIDQENEGFPLKGITEETKDNNTKNIRTFLPKAGVYKFRIDIKSKAYSVEPAE